VLFCDNATSTGNSSFSRWRLYVLLSLISLYTPPIISFACAPLNSSYLVSLNPQDVKVWIQELQHFNPLLLRYVTILNSSDLPHFLSRRRRRKRLPTPSCPWMCRMQRLDSPSIWIPLYINDHCVSLRGLRWLLLSILVMSTSRVTIFSISSVWRETTRRLTI
jgi:hypothetical protein